MDAQKILQSCVADAQRRPTIRLNSHGALVQTWQTLLRAQLGPSVPVDGVFGPSTHAATMTLQRKAGLRPDGVVGSKTWAAGSVAACYALAVSRAQAAPQAAKRAAQTLNRATHGLGAVDLSFSVVDPKSMALGLVLGVGLGAVLFRRK